MNTTLEMIRISQDMSNTRHLRPKHIDGSHDHPDNILPYPTGEEVESVESYISSLSLKLLHIFHVYGDFELLLKRYFFIRSGTLLLGIIIYHDGLGLA